MASAIRILLQYIMTGATDFLDAKRLCALIGEYRETLSFADIGTVRALLCAWLLKNVKDRNVIASVLREITVIPAAVTLEETPAPADAGRVADRILAELTQNDRIRLRSVIYRTESGRQTLDRLGVM